MTDRNARRRCPRCHRPAPTCVCADLPRIRNRTCIRILQHPRERFHPVGSAAIAELGLARCTVDVARDLVCAPSDPDGTALLFPSPASVDLAALAADERPRSLVVLDGTWRQAKRLYHENPWLAQLPHVRLDPERPSRYRVRRPPSARHLSTLESIVEALRLLEPETAGLDALLVAFDAMNARQAAFMRSPDRTPRWQQPRQRPSRRLPAGLFDDGLALVYAELAPSACAVGGARDLLQFVAIRVGGDRRAFEAWLRPPAGAPDLAALHHLGLDASPPWSSPAAARAAFAAFAADVPVLAAWNRLPLELAAEHFGWRGPTVLLKAAYANVRGGRCGELRDVVAAERLAVRPLPFAGRAAQRLADALAVAELLRGLPRPSR
ncbi:MAG: DTW domain-containing protein [Planctomycetes bacterium]|nr:DTW domain-containing protein [Planctomycetota bacterium]